MKNRVHLDLRWDDLPVELERRVFLGAVIAARHDLVVRRDPEGNGFCVGRG